MFTTLNIAPKKPVNEIGIRATHFQIAKARSRCWKCSQTTTVFSIVLPDSFETLECVNENEAEEPERYEWCGHGYPVILSYLSDLTPAAEAAIKASTKNYFLDFSRTTKSFYWLNHCEHCNANQGDFQMHCEPQGAFSPMYEEEALGIELKDVREAIGCNASMTIDPEYLDAMRPYWIDELPDGTDLGSHDQNAKLRKKFKKIWDCDPLFIDTETTGFDSAAEVIEVSVVDKNGLVIFHSLVKSVLPIPPRTTEIHGIRDEDLRFAPRWPEVAVFLRMHLLGRVVVAHNAEFDMRLINQTCARYDVPIPDVDKVFCTMEALKENNAGRKPRLSVAMEIVNAKAPDTGQAHRATYDALCCQRIVKKIVMG